MLLVQESGDRPSWSGKERPIKCGEFGEIGIKSKVRQSGMRAGWLKCSSDRPPIPHLSRSFSAKSFIISGRVLGQPKPFIHQPTIILMALSLIQQV